MEQDELERAKEALFDDDDDDLEFHLTFPAPVSAAPPPKAGNGETESPISREAEEEGPEAPRCFSVRRIVRRSDPEPLVFLLGWAGCEDSQLAEYSRVYEQMGCATVRYTAPADYLYLQPARLKPLAAKLVELVAEMSMESSPVLVHAFGNNGAAVYQRMSEAAHRGDAPADHAVFARNLGGVVFDSGPGQRAAADFLAAASHSLAAQGLASASTADSSGDGGNDLDQSASLWCYDFVQGRDQSRAPCLFLYSAEDAVVSPSDVQRVAESRQAAGSDVDQVCFDQGEHVRLLQAHQEAYTKALVQFTSKCLSKEMPEEGQGSIKVEKGKKPSKSD